MYASSRSPRFPVVRTASCLAALCVPLALQLVAIAAGPVPEAMWPVLVLSVWASLMTASLSGLAVLALGLRVLRALRRRSAPLVRLHG